MKEKIEKKSLSADRTGGAELTSPKAGDTSSAKRLTSWMRKGQQKYARAWEAWSFEDDLLLEEMVRSKYALRKICDILGRGPRGVSTRIRRLGLLHEGIACRAVRNSRVLPVPLTSLLPQGEAKAEGEWVAEMADVWGVSYPVLQRSLRMLSPCHSQVFVWRYGLCGRCAYTVEAIAQVMHLSASRVEDLIREAEGMVRRSLESLGASPWRVTWRETLRRAYSTEIA